EAGFVPGIVLYLTFWFPQSHLARATGVFMITQPVTIAFGSALSGLILEMNHFGLAGWQWLFLLEGVPAIILGVMAYYYLPNGPDTSAWLAPEERRVLQQVIRSHQSTSRSDKVIDRGYQELFSRNIILLSIIYFGLV